MVAQRPGVIASQVHRGHHHLALGAVGDIGALEAVARIQQQGTRWVLGAELVDQAHQVDQAARLLPSGSGTPGFNGAMKVVGVKEDDGLFRARSGGTRNLGPRRGEVPHRRYRSVG